MRPSAPRHCGLGCLPSSVLPANTASVTLRNTQVVCIHEASHLFIYSEYLLDPSCIPCTIQVSGAKK